MNTSDFASCKNHPNAVSIARSNRFHKVRSYLPLAPSREMLDAFRLTGDAQQFDRAYAGQLAALDPHQVLKDLGPSAILLCYELPGVRCHRRLVAEWLEAQLGILIPELGFTRDQCPSYAQLPRNERGPGAKAKPKLLRPRPRKQAPTPVRADPPQLEIERSPTMKRRPSGTGSIYRRSGSPIYWIKFSRAGVSFAETTHSTDKTVAAHLLRDRLAQIQTGSFLGKREKTTFDELLDDFENYAQVVRMKSESDVRSRLRLHIRTFPGFRGRLATEIGADTLTTYVRHRQEQGAQDSTINRELACVSAAFRLGRDNRKVRDIPKIPHLKERNVRKGFVEDADFEKLVTGSELWFRALCTCGFVWGWRVGELIGLRVEQVDLLSRTVRLHAGTTKNDQPRIGPMTDGLFVLLSECVRGKKPTDQVFTRPNGKPVRSFVYNWHKACVRAGLGELSCPKCKTVVGADLRCASCNVRWSETQLLYRGLIFHDLRRSGVKGMIRSGVSQTVAMRISGHKTISVFKRYEIVSEQDLTDAAAKVQARQTAQMASEPKLQSSYDRSGAQQQHPN